MAIWTQDAVDALAAAVYERRHIIGRSQVEVWKNDGPSNSTMTSLEKAASRSVTRSTLNKLDAGLAWVPDTAGKVIRGELSPSTAARDARFDARPTNEIAGLDDAGARDELPALIVALAVDADDVQLRTRALSTDVDEHDPEAVKSFVAEVQDVFGDMDDLADSVDVVAHRVFGGDAERLRQVKRETKRFRRRLPGSSSVGTAAAVVETEPAALADMRAARTAPSGYATGRSEQGEAIGDITDRG